jgi:hypothetical protein
MDLRPIVAAAILLFGTGINGLLRSPGNPNGGLSDQTGVLSASSLNGIIYVDGVTYSRNNVGIQAAVNATPAGGTIILPPGTYTLTGTGSEEILITRSIHFICSGWGTVLQVGSLVPNTTDVFRLKPSGLVRDIVIQDCAVTPQSGAPGRYGISIDAQGASSNQVANAIFTHNWIGTLKGNYSIATINPPRTGNGVLWASTITGNELVSGGILLNGTGDSINVTENVITGSNAAVELNSLSGASHNVVERNNMTTVGGCFLVHGATQPKFVFNQCEQTIATTESNSAMVDLNGDDYSVGSALIAGNNLNIHGNATNVVRVNAATNTIINDGNELQLKSITGVGVLITGLASGTIIGPNAYFGATNGAVSVSDFGNGTQYYNSSGPHKPGARIIAPADGVTALTLVRKSAASSSDILAIADQNGNLLLGVGPDGALSGISSTLSTKSTPYTLTQADYWINVTGTTTVTVPHADRGRLWTVFNSGSGTVTLRCDTGNINGAASITLAGNTGKEVTCDGTNCWAR